jgi:hypothetical protein
MTLIEIKQAVNEGNKVHWVNSLYTVEKSYFRGTNDEDWNIVCSLNNHCIGLTWTDEITMNGKESDFFISKQ